MSKEITRKHWSLNDVAFAYFARYKGLKNFEIGTILGRTPQSVANFFWQLKHMDSLPSYDKRRQLFDKALVYEMQVRGGQFADIRDIWLKRISAINGVTYTYSTPPETETEEVVTEENTTPETSTPDVDTNDSKWNSDQQEVLRISFTVNSRALGNVLDVLKTLWNQKP